MRLYFQQEGQKKNRLTKIIFVTFLVLGIIGLLTPNPAETFISCLLFPVLFSILWQPNQIPILLFAATFQTLEIIIPVIRSNLIGITLYEQFGGSELSLSFYFSSTSIIFLACGMRFGLGKLSKIPFSELNLDSLNFSPLRLTIAYLFSFFLSIVLNSFAFRYGAITQLVLPISSLKWVIIFLIGWVGLRKNNLKPLIYSILVIEIILGFTGFFSEFKEIFFLFITLTCVKIQNIRNLLNLNILFLLGGVLILSTYWQSVKGEYRHYISLGEYNQTVQIPVSERINFHLRHIKDFDVEDFSYGLDSGFQRLGYLDFFAYSIRQVPSSIPHQNGRLWYEAIRHILTPRILFPNKPAIHDSDRTNEFTRLGVAGADKGTSISIGYLGESYIDFGFPWMLIPIFTLGYFWGRAFQFLLKTAKYSILGLASGTTLILNFCLTTGFSNIKLVGGAVATLIIYWLILKFFSRFLLSILLKNQKKV